MKRDIYHQLILWKNSTRRKPLIIQGARQVGKTYVIKEFAQHEYLDYIYCNFETNLDLSSLFATNINPKNIIDNLAIQFNQKINPETTLIIFDEIQACPNALNSLKYFREEANQYHIISAGSLLGVKLNQIKSFPVGQINFLHLHPLSFLEFLDANNESALRQLLENTTQAENIPTIFHNRLIEQLKRYVYIGGMPEAVSTFVTTRDYSLIRTIHNEILKAYEFDFSKHTDKTQSIKITEVWQAIPSQLAKENKKFIFSLIKTSARAREYENAIMWLRDAGLINVAYNISTPKIPLEHYANKNYFKVFALDTGLLASMTKVPLQAILHSNELFTEFKGALTENYVAQQLSAHKIEQLYYWTSQGNAEVDFVINTDSGIFPLEVKSGTNVGRKKSLLTYDNKYTPNLLSRTSLCNLSKDGKILNYPLYALNLFPKLGL